MIKYELIEIDNKETEQIYWFIKKITTYKFWFDSTEIIGKYVFLGNMNMPFFNKNEAENKIKELLNDN